MPRQSELTHDLSLIIFDTGCTTETQINLAITNFLLDNHYRIKPAELGPNLKNEEPALIESELELAKYNKIAAIKCLRNRYREAGYDFSLIEYKRAVEKQMGQPIEWTNEVHYKELEKILKKLKKDIVSGVTYTAEQWESLLNVHIIDADGWGATGPNFVRFDDKIDCLTFLKCLSESTAKF